MKSKLDPKNYTFGFIQKWSAFYSSLNEAEVNEYAVLTMSAVEAVKEKLLLREND